MDPTAKVCKKAQTQLCNFPLTAISECTEITMRMAPPGRTCTVQHAFTHFDVCNSSSHSCVDQATQCTARRTLAGPAGLVQKHNRSADQSVSELMLDTGR